MELTQKVVAQVRAQFGRPTERLGLIAGLIMAHRSSNRRRNAWAVSLLELGRRRTIASWWTTAATAAGFPELAAAPETVS